MKKFTFLFAAILIGQMATAKIWRVNNTPGVTADYTTIQAAHDHVNTQPGDTIHLEPSINAYGALTMTKRLTIISVGNFLGSNPGSQYVLVPGTMTSLNVTNATASNSVFHCNFNSSVSITNANNMRFERCRIESSLNFNQSSNNVILNNFVQSISLSNGNNTIIANNIIEWYCDVNSTTGNTILTNNVFFAVTAITNRAMHNATLQNNIINKNGGFALVNCIVENNIASNTAWPAGSGNQNSVNMATVFVNPNGTDDASFVLQTSVANPAVGTGKEGVNCGAYGGNNPFKRGLQPAIPAIYKLSAPVAPSGNTMNVIFSTRSNN